MQWRGAARSVGALTAVGGLMAVWFEMGTRRGVRARTEEQDGINFRVEEIRGRQGSRTRLRRANTRLSSLESVVLGYEYRLRETASLEKVFKYFSSVVVDGEEFMTPLDLVRAISPGVPPSENSKPINIPMFEKRPGELEFSKQAMPDFFKFGPDDPGLIAYPRFLVIVTLFALPAAEIPVAYGMCAGEDFKRVQLRGTDLNIHNFHFIMERNIKIRGQGYTTDHKPPSIAHFLFGPDLKRTLTFEEFRDFHLKLRDNIEKMQYFLLSDELGENEEPIMSLPAFAMSVAALVPSDYRSDFWERAMKMRAEEVSQVVVEQEMQQGRLKLATESHDTKVVANQIKVSFEDYVNWQEILRSLPQMEEAVKRYSYQDGHFTPTNLTRAAFALTGVKLTKAQVWAIFKLFDADGNNELHHDEFVRLLQPHSMSVNPRFEDEGLGLGGLFSCLYTSCSKCTRGWYEGTPE